MPTTPARLLANYRRWFATWFVREYAKHQERLKSRDWLCVVETRGALHALRLAACSVRSVAVEDLGTLLVRFEAAAKRSAIRAASESRTYVRARHIANGAIWRGLAQKLRKRIARTARDSRRRAARARKIAA